MQSQAGPAQQEVPPQVASLPEQVASLPESGSNAGLAGAQPSVPIQQPASLPLSSQPGPLSSSHDLEGAGGTLSPLTQGQSEQSRRGQHESASEEEAGTPVASLLAQGQAGGQATSMGLDSVRLNVNTADGGTEDAQETQGYVLAASEAHTALEAAQAEIGRLRGLAAGYSTDQVAIIIWGAKGLKDSDFIGKSDPYCAVRVGPLGTSWEQKRRGRKSVVVPGSLAPTWNLGFCVSVAGYAAEPELMIGIFDKD